MPDPNEMPIKIPGNTLKRISKAAEAYAERRLEDIAVPELVTSDARKIVKHRVFQICRGIAGLDPRGSLHYCLSLCLSPLLEKMSTDGIYSEYFGKEMLKTSFKISHDLRSSCESESLLEEYYTWLVDVTKTVYNEVRNLIIKNSIKSPPKPEPALDMLTDLAIVKTLAKLDYKTLKDSASRDIPLNLEFLRLSIPEPPHLLDDNELMNCITVSKVVIRSTPLDIVVSNSAKSVLGLCLISSILNRRGMDKRWIVEAITNWKPRWELKGEDIENIIRETAEEVLERLKSELKRSTKKGVSLSELGLNDIESFLTEVARRIIKIMWENAQLAQVLLIDEYEKVVENLLSADRVLRIGNEAIRPEELDPEGMSKEEAHIESISVSDLVKKAMGDVMNGFLDTTRKAVKSEGGFDSERPSVESPSKRSSGGRESEDSLSDFAWDVAQTVMKEIVRELTSDKKRR
ncbi:hypothetical protein [Methanopyrus sp.]